MIEESGLKWSVVESIPVSESIKTGKIDSTNNMTRQNFISNYKQSIINMSKAGLGDIYVPMCWVDLSFNSMVLDFFFDRNFRTATYLKDCYIDTQFHNKNNPWFETQVKSELGHINVTLDILCYNFMPVVDWTRTDLEFEYNDGSNALKFDFDAFAAFDIFLMKRTNAQNDYTPEQYERYFL